MTVIISPQQTSGDLKCQNWVSVETDATLLPPLALYCTLYQICLDKMLHCNTLPDVKILKTGILQDELTQNRCAKLPSAV